MRIFLVAISLMAFTFTTNAQGLWTAVLTENYESQEIKDVYSFSALETFIREQAKVNRVISDVTWYGDDSWVAVASYKSKATYINWKKQKDFPNEFIKTEWDNGKHISSVEFGNGEWLVIMTTKDEYTRQSWAIRDSWSEMETWIKSKWDESRNYIITQMTYGNGKWVCVMSGTPTYEPNAYYSSETFPTSWIQGKFDNKYNIMAVEHDGKKWYVAMAKRTNFKGETILNPDSKYPSAKIDEEFKKPRRVKQLVYTGYKDYNAYLADLDWMDFFDEAPTSTYDDHVRSGQDNLDKKYYYTAISDFEKALKIKSTDATVWNNLAWAKYLTKQCDAALSDINKSLSIKSYSYNNHTKAAILKCQNKCAESLTYFTEAIRLRRIEEGSIDDALYYADRAEARRCTGNYSGAADDLELALAIDPNNAELKKKMNEVMSLMK